jgi:hypothetical protein
MPLNWESHVCTYYCQDGIHAVPLLAKPGATADLIATILRAEPRLELAVLSVRAVAEVDVAAWQREMFTDPEVWTSSGSGGRTATPEQLAQATVPFLALVKELSTEETNDAS